MRFWDVGRTPARSTRQGRAIIIAIALLAAALFLQSTPLWAIVSIVGFALLVALAWAGVSEQLDEQPPRLHSTLDPIPWHRTPRRHQLIVAGLLVAAGALVLARQIGQ